MHDPRYKSLEILLVNDAPEHSVARHNDNVLVHYFPLLRFDNLLNAERQPLVIIRSKLPSL